MPEAAQERIPYSCQTIDDDDIGAVADCLRSPFLTQGPMTAQFERETADYIGAAHGVAVSNGTAALHLLYQALGVNQNSLIWTSPISFVASANAARYLGAAVDFVDVDPATGCIDPAALDAKFAKAASVGKLPNVLAAVHLAGHSFGFDRIAELCAQFDVTLVEDAAHAFGALYQDNPARKIGAHPLSAAATFSFHPLKSITTGEGGMVTTNCPTLADTIAQLRSHGITKSPEAMRNMRAEDGDWYYEQHALGFNYRICDILAALGLSQLRKLDQFMDARRSCANRYRELLADLPLHLPHQTDASSWHLYAVRLDRDETSLTRKALFDQLRTQGIEAHVHYIPIHTQPYYRDLGFGPGDFPSAEDYYNTCLSLPIYPRMRDVDQDHVASCIKQAFVDA
ncbi:MAG: UDP-4-amino-4,6-dideoxy-N-acetyl-beta-L-altrosamine transaminase [Yoonia sp.]|uniref:UDP-4-amino-4, 6-dideoxy-N-acetyl-beta-L-altrosamine transaminase n=1 Tax=Yoonia sp. TaxID=2212373 RepID=UPI003EF687E4